MIEAVLNLLPDTLKSIMNRVPRSILHQIEEIRIRENRPLEIVYSGTYHFISNQGQMLNSAKGAYQPNHQDILKFLNIVTNHSMYTIEEELKRGYITVKGGHRIGLSGRTVLEHGFVKQIRDVSSFNIRIAREVIGAGEQVLPSIMDVQRKSIYHTLIISPPQLGKTTLLRDLSRMISYGLWNNQVSWKGLKVGIVDERSEIAACYKGVPYFDVGPRTDVLDSCPKAEGMMMLIRSMSPEVMIVDEIGRDEDVKAIHEAVHAGIRVITTSHALNMEDIKNRPILKQLCNEGIFSRYVVLSRRQGIGTIEEILDEKGNRMMQKSVDKVRG
ncbi:stage III sporulation protein AA [Chengkuizengella axinellae]|uniref:Stage III sporulation protein AA n=1 Tax=Chengkuizengella axinellae TaxID=3064388 RepID=A0ABT9J239_9BACL|nr:stage III sporulation protein AA [Chengkuizengella sp. 2205SS18-9]MDP5275674.1 stage III sporulation protein AA [Chengkuizengella sp. 2205SS18-9]